MLTFFYILAYCLATFLKTSANIVLPAFQEQFFMSTSLVGFISSVYFIPYAVMQLMTGSLCRRYGAEKTTSTCLLFAIIGILMFAFAKGPAWIIIGRFLMGFGLGPVYISTIYHLTQKYEGKKYLTLTSISVGAANFAAASASAPLRAMIQALGIKTSFIILALVSFICMFGILFFKDKHTASVDQIENVFVQTKRSFQYMFSQRALVYGMLIWLFFAIIDVSYVGLWCTKWAMEAFPQDLNKAGLFGTACSIFIMLGSLSGGKINFFKGDYKKIVTGESWLLIISIVVMGLTHITGPLFLALLGSCMFGFFTGHLNVEEAMFCRQYSSAEENASVMGLWNFVAALGVFAGQWGTGGIIEALSSTAYPYSYTHFILAAMFALILLYYKFSKSK